MSPADYKAERSIVMEIKNVESEAIAGFEEELQLENVKYLTLCTEEGIVAWLAGIQSDQNDEIEVQYGFEENFNESVARQLYVSFMEHNIPEEIVFNPESEDEEKFIESL